MSGVLVDTSVWVEFFRGKTIPGLETALEQGTVVLSPIVVAELVSGSDTKSERRQVQGLLELFDVHETPIAHWQAVGALRANLRLAGFHVSIPDAHVARCAIERAALLLSRDAIFGKIASRCHLKVVVP